MRYSSLNKLRDIKHTLLSFMCVKCVCDSLLLDNKLIMQTSVDLSIRFLFSSIINCLFLFFSS